MNIPSSGLRSFWWVNTVNALAITGSPVNSLKKGGIFQYYDRRTRIYT
jgi:hypothetical protein